MLTRIYGTAFHSQAELDEHLARLEAARENDHRRLGPELDLFRFREEAPGMPFWLPNGTVLLRSDRGRGRRPSCASAATSRSRRRAVLDEELWHRSGHWDNYRENMYFVEAAERENDGRRFALKPMNCPGACLVFGAERHSYRDLPLRLAEFGRRLPLRARGRPARAAAGAGVHPGRRARLLHARPGRRRGRLDERDDRRALRPLRLRAGPGRAVHPAGEVDRGRRAVGARRGGARATRSTARAATISSTPATEPSTARRSTSTSPTRSGARGSWAPSSSTSRCPSASSSPIRARTTPSTRR